MNFFVSGVELVIKFERIINFKFFIAHVFLSIKTLGSKSEIFIIKKQNYNYIL